MERLIFNCFILCHHHFSAVRQSEGNYLSPHQHRQEIIKGTILQTLQSVNLKHQDLCLAKKNREHRKRITRNVTEDNQKTGLVYLNCLLVQYSLATAKIVKTQILFLVKTVQLSRKPMLEICQVGRDKLEKLIIFSSAELSAPRQRVVCCRSCLLIYRVREALKICLIVMIIVVSSPVPLRQALMSFDG